MGTAAVRRMCSAVVLVPFIALAVACGGDSGDLRTEVVSDQIATEGLSFVIPQGAGEASDAGTPLEILPARLDVSVGDVIEIRNDDDRGHLVGPFFVGADETLVQRFESPGEFIGACTVHPSGEIVVVVS